MMQSQDTIDPHELPKCRICWQIGGKSISPCACAGSMAYIHEECLKLWIEKSVQRGSRNPINKQDGFTSIICELCKNEITFKMAKEPTCLNCADIKEKIKQNLGSFFVMLFVIIGMGVIAFVLLAQGVSDLQSKNYTIWGIIFLFCFVALVFALEARFLYSFIKAFFRGNNYQISDFRPRGRN